MVVFSVGFEVCLISFIWFVVEDGVEGFSDVIVFRFYIRGRVFGFGYSV